MSCLVGRKEGFLKFHGEVVTSLEICFGFGVPVRERIHWSLRVDTKLLENTRFVQINGNQVGMRGMRFRLRHISV